MTPADNNAFQKRLKRHVVGKLREYFISVSPGLETVCMNELSALPGSLTDVSIINGGIRFKGNLTDCYTANLHLRTANRILMRLAQFTATNFKSLEKHVSEIPWELFLYPDSDLEIRVTVKRSRLYHSDAVADRIKAGILHRIRSTVVLQTESGTCHQIFVRSEDDQFTISLDTSGDLLYKRGMKHHDSKAPIRETLAAAILKIAGYAYPSVLIDPMCGSGTFSLEAAMIGTQTPPGWHRPFAFMTFPAFRLKQWMHLRKKAQNTIKFPERQMIFASDLDAVCVQRLKQTLDTWGLTNAVSVSCLDFFSFTPSDFTDQKGLVTINPPYGVRLGTMRESGHLLKKICNHLKKEYIGWKAGLIIPEHDMICLAPFLNQVHPFIHGGQKRFLAYGII